MVEELVAVSAEEEISVVVMEGGIVEAAVAAVRVLGNTPGTLYSSERHTFRPMLWCAPRTMPSTAEGVEISATAMSAEATVVEEMMVVAVMMEGVIVEAAEAAEVAIRVLGSTPGTLHSSERHTFRPMLWCAASTMPGTVGQGQLEVKGKETMHESAGQGRVHPMLLPRDTRIQGKGV
eukprot:1164880-Prymnesium_polylepis.3